MSRFGIGDEPYEYSIEPAETIGWWVRVGHGFYSYEPDWCWTLRGAHHCGQRKVAAAEQRRDRMAAKRGMI